MASTPTVLATRDSMAKVSVKGPHGPTTLPAHQAANQFIPSVEVVRNFSANTTGGWGTYSEFVLEVSQLPHIVDDITLALTFGAATKTGGTVISFVNDAAFLARMVEISVGAEILVTMFPEAQYLRRVLHKTTEQKSLLLVAAGNDTVAHRRTNAAAGQTLLLPLRIPFVGKYGYFAGQQSAQLRIKVYHAALTDVILTDGTVPVCPINAVALNVSGRNYINGANVGALIATQKKLGSVSERFLDVVQQQFTLVSGSANYTLQTTNFNGHFTHLLFVVRAASSVGTPLANAPDAFLAVQSYSLSDGAGNVVLPSTSSAYALGPYTAKYVTGNGMDNGDAAQKNVYPVWFSSRPEEALLKGTAHGSYKMTGVDKINIVFAAATSANYVLDVIGYVQSQISADANGNVKKAVVV